MREFVQSLDVPTGQTKRVACPNCGGSNTLSVTKEGGELKWLCFRASCGVRGRAGAIRTREDVEERLRQERENGPCPWEPPAYFTSPMSDDVALRYMQRYNITESYAKGWADIRFDPRSRRVVFGVYHNGTLIDGAGRALERESHPKWYRYRASGYPFVCGVSSVAVVVEDCASACAVAPVAAGVALLGTNLQSTHLAPLRNYDEVIIALDKDATRKSLEIRQRMSFFARTSVVILEEDLKEHGPDDIRQILGLPGKT